MGKHGSTSLGFCRLFGSRTPAVPRAVHAVHTRRTPTQNVLGITTLATTLQPSSQRRNPSMSHPHRQKTRPAMKGRSPGGNDGQVLDPGVGLADRFLGGREINTPQVSPRAASGPSASYTAPPRSSTSASRAATWPTARATHSDGPAIPWTVPCGSTTRHANRPQPTDPPETVNHHPPGPTDGIGSRAPSSGSWCSWVSAWWARSTRRCTRYPRAGSGPSRCRSRSAHRPRCGCAPS